MVRIAAACLFVLSLNAEEPKLRVPTATAGFGNILYPGTGGPPAPKPQFTQPIFPKQTAPSIRNVKPVTSQRQRVLFLPVYFPLPFYGFAPGASDLPPAEQPPVAIVNPAYVPERPQPSMREYPVGSLPEPATQQTQAMADPEKPTVYLIAMKDSSVYSAYAYWVEDGTLHYITTQHSPNRASVELVDGELSAQLNRERGVEFKLPTP